MKILTKERTQEMLGDKPLDNLLSELSCRLQVVGGAYSIPSDSGRKTALSRLFAYLLLRKPNTCIYVSGWGVWSSSENFDLFYGYRRSYGENRTLMEAPVHLFEQSETDAFVSILSMAFYFIWDAWVFDTEGKTVVKLSHDEWFEVRSDDEDVRKEFATELDRYEIPLLTQ